MYIVLLKATTKYTIWSDSLKKKIIIIKNLKNFSSNQKEVKKNIETEPEEAINSNELADLSHNIFIIASSVSSQSKIKIITIKI